MNEKISGSKGENLTNLETKNLKGNCKGVKKQQITSKFKFGVGNKLTLFNSRMLAFERNEKI